MISWKRKCRLYGSALLAACTVPLAADAGAQTRTGIASYSYQLGSTPREDPAATLSRHVRDLSSNPKSLVALKGAGAAALRLGDVEAAGGFFARAEEVSPRDGEVKAGIASVLAMMGQPEAALRLFAEASSLGVPDRDLAGYRGLARDLMGDQQAAQKDYALALRTHDDAPEVARRLALSQAISGQRLKALATIEEQLRYQDKAAWRTRAFILALTGDYEAAAQAVRVALPAQASAFAPFLARLPSLSPAEKASAVHLGILPVTFQNLRTSDAALPEEPAVQVAVASTIAQEADTQQPVQAGALGAGGPALGAVPAVASASQGSAPAPLRFADVADMVQDLPASIRPAAKKSEPAATEAARPQAKKTVAKKQAPPKKSPAEEHPARSWVQLASGANVAALPREYGRIRSKAEKALAGKTAWTTRAGATNRLLVGPFKTAKEAQAFVNDLAKDKVNGFAWTSAAGQEIEKLPAR